MRIEMNTELTGALSWLNNRPVFVSMSGGKDSTAMGLYLQELGIKFTPVFLDTGWEHPATYDYINDVLTPLFGKFKVLRNERYFVEDAEWKGGMEQLIKKEKMFPSGAIKFCTRELKIVPIMNFYDEIRCLIKTKPVNVVGIRAQESTKRAKMAEIEEQDEATVWRPLIDWSEKKVISYHHKYSVPPNPLYLKGYSRVGCYPCIFTRKEGIRHMSFADPTHIDYLADLENRVNKLRREDQSVATFFQSKMKTMDVMYIKDVVKWSRQRGNITLNDQDEIEDSGCMRWGLCEPIGMQLELFPNDTD